MSTFGERLSNAIKNSGLTKKYIAEKLNTTTTTVYRWEKNINQANDDVKKQLAKLLDVSLSYLMGESSTSKLDSIEADLSGPFRKTIPVPLYAEGICCGKGFSYGADDNSEQPESFLPFCPPAVGQGANGKIIAIRVSGNSMIDAGIREGSIIFVVLDSEIHDRQPGVVCVGPDHKMLVRCVIRKPDGSKVLRAKNSRYPDEIVSLEDIEAGWYREIGPIIQVSSTPEWA